MTRELATLGDLVAAHVCSGIAGYNVISTLYKSWTERIRSLSHMSTPEATALTVASNSGPWRAHEKFAFSELVMQHNGPSPRTQPRGNRTQNHALASRSKTS